MHPEASVTLEIAVHTMAMELGMTPLEFYRKNLVTDDTKNQDNDRAMTSRSPRVCLERAASYIGYESKYHAPGARTLSDGRMHGIGIIAHHDRHGNTSGGRAVVVYMNSDGTANFVTGQSNNQVGCNSVGLAVIVAEALGLPFEAVVCSSYGTADQAPDGGSQAGSRGASSNGTAALNAALDIREQMFAFVAGELEVSADDLDARDGVIFVKTDPSKFMTHSDVMSDIDGPIIGFGRSHAERGAIGGGLRKPTQGEEVGYDAYHREGVAAAYEVAVDTETGEVEILDWIHVLDVGRILDHYSAEGQRVSGMWVQYNKTFLWDVKYDPQTGTELHQTHVENKTATHMDIPEPNGDKNTAEALELIDAIGPFGAHGIGEPSAPPGYSALIMAINNALGGEMIKTRPVTPMVILKHLGKA